MCISAEASFGLAGVLVPAGAYCIQAAARKNTVALPLSIVPAAFAVQQFMEGLVWVGLGRHDPDLTRLASLAFLFFALVFWLFWIPFGAIFIESRPRFKALFGAGALLGLAGGLFFYAPLVADAEVLQVAVDHHSIQYNIARSPAMQAVSPLIWHCLYLTIIALPLAFLKDRKVFTFSLALVLSAVASHFIFWYAFASVWCFFAALLSIYLCVLFHDLEPAN